MQAKTLSQQSLQQWIQLDRDLFLCRDTCNVYVLRYEDRALAIDFGSGRWLTDLEAMGVRRLEHVILTHAHRDQCCGLYRHSGWPFAIHAPAGDAHLVREDRLKKFWQTYQANGCPSSYAAPRLPLPQVQTEMTGDSEKLLGPIRLCALSTPGHTPGALTYLVEWHGRHLALCGDAVHAGSALHQPYHLEWDHWTPGGALAAWYGLERLSYCHFDLLLPSHGPVIRRAARTCVRQTQKRLMTWIRAKGSVCAGEKNRWFEVESTASGAGRVLPHLYRFGGNGFLLIDDSGRGLVVDPTLSDMNCLNALMEEIGLKTISVATASHYHIDHTDALDHLRQRYGTAVWLHPRVAEPICQRDRYDLPWLPPTSVAADRLLPEEGRFRWSQYRFAIRPFPGQTWWHCAFDAWIDGRHVLFSGDNFQPPSRWNGTGGFCAFNGSRFHQGFALSAQTVLDLTPEIICNGHGNIYRFARSHYHRIMHWAEEAENALKALCPNATWLTDYDYHACRWDPFITSTRPDERFALNLVYHNHDPAPIRLQIAAIGPPGWNFSPDTRRIQVASGKSRRCRFWVRIPRRSEGGRHLIAADLQIDDQLRAEACVALVDIT